MITEDCYLCGQRFRLFFSFSVI